MYDKNNIKEERKELEVSCYKLLILYKRSITIFFIHFYWSIVALQCCVSFLLYSKVNQSYIYIYPLLFRFPSHLGLYRVLSRVPVLHSRSLLVTYFIHSSVYVSIPISQFIPLPPFPSGNHKFVFYICDSISVL